MACKFKIRNINSYNSYFEVHARFLKTRTLFDIASKYVVTFTSLFNIYAKKKVTSIIIFSSQPFIALHFFYLELSFYGITVYMKTSWMNPIVQNSYRSNR